MRLTHVVKTTLSMAARKPLGTSFPNLGIVDTGKPKTIVVEGNIASGKTSFLESFRKTDAHLIIEPVDKWRNLRGHNLLNLMYEDPDRWSLTFQTYVQLTMLQAHTDTTSDSRTKLMERSIYSARHCFVENLYRSGKMPEVEYNVLDQWYQFITKNMNIPVDLIIYLQTTPETVYQRLRSRSRDEEMTVSMDYLRTLHDLHENWLFHNAAIRPNCKILTIDANRPLEELRPEFELLRIKLLGNKQKLPKSIGPVSFECEDMDDENIPMPAKQRSC